MCGEQLKLIDEGANPQGSPPRVRGTENAAIEAATQHRITPACAGNSNPAQQLHKTVEDHPRVCGEQAYKGENSNAK